MPSSSRIASGVATFVVLLGGVTAAFLPAVFATREMRAFCGSISVGAPLNELESQADSRGYSVLHVGGNHVYIEHPRSLGRAYCDVEFDPQGIVTARAADF